MAPPSEQTSSIILVATRGDAAATPSVKAHHTRTRRMSVEDVRGACIEALWLTRHTTHAYP